MRIEISSGGFGGAAVSQLQDNLSSYISDANSMIASFKTVRGATSNLNGGVGNLQGALDEINLRITSEESKLQDAENIQSRIDQFVELTVKTDSTVSNIVNNNKEELYQVSPWLKPSATVEEEKPWYEQAWDFLCDTKDAIVEDAKTTWGWISDTAKKAWDGAVSFYQEHKKIFDTVFVVVGAIAAVVAVVATGGVALVPLLCAIGAPTAVATVLSVTVAIVAVVSMVASSTLNVVDIWMEIDNDTFNSWQKHLNRISTISNLAYSVGNIYNSFKGVSGKEYLAREKAIKNGKMGYSNLEAKHPDMNHKSGADYDQARKKAVYEENMRRNDGVLRSDQTGKILDTPQKSAKGVSPSEYEAQVDHIFPRSKGGYNSFENAQVIERSANIQKGNQLGFTDYMKYSRPDTTNYKDLIASAIQAGGSNYQTWKRSWSK